MQTGARWRLRLHNVVFVLSLLTVIALLAWLSRQYHWQSDWTAGQRNTLSEESRTLLQRLDAPITITAYVKEDPALRQRIKQRMARYQRHKPDLQLAFVNPELRPKAAKQAGVMRPGQLVVSRGERREVIDDMSEQTLTNALQRLTRDAARWAVFLEGHNERSPFAEDNQGLSQLHAVLSRGGFSAQGLNLIRTPVVPDNTSLLVVAAPQSALIPGEVETLLAWLRAGGNLLWLHDPGEDQGLEPLAQALGIDWIDGVVVDANQQVRSLLGIDHPAIVPVVNYGLHKITRDLGAQTLFPFAVAIDVLGDSASESSWASHPLLHTLERTWSETSGLGAGDVSFDEQNGDRLGPLTLGVALTRERETGTQRVAVIGDSDFLANSYVGNGRNLDLAVNLFNWLSADDDLLSINLKAAPDTRLELSNTYIAILAFGFLLALPLGLLATGFTVWFRRRRR